MGTDDVEDGHEREEAVRRPEVRLYDGAPARVGQVSPRTASTEGLAVDVAHAVLESSTALVCVFDVEGRFLLFNRACEELSGFRADEVLARGVWETLVVPEERDVARSEMAMIVSTGRGAVVEGTWQDRAGDLHLIAWHNTVLADEQGVPDRMVCVGVDITEQRRVEERLRELAGTDALTGLLNRRAVVEALSRTLDPRGDGCGLLYCDLDGFKRVNDTLGHSAGDELLIVAGARLRAAVRSKDLVGRLGGDEFVVLCEGSDDETLAGLSLRIREALGAPYRLHAGPTRIGVSVGVHLAAAGTSAQEALAIADRRMYRAKGMTAPTTTETGR